jgi:purine-binding chemotaxis protein CheW
MKKPTLLVVFTLEEKYYALYLSTVERIVRVVEVTTLPKAPEIVLGVVNVAGRIVPVVDIRKRFRLPKRELNLSDQLVIANSSQRSVALVVDSVIGVSKHRDADVIPAGEVLPWMEYVEGIVKVEGEMILIHDLDRFLSLEEGETLDNALKET